MKLHTSLFLILMSLLLTATRGGEGQCSSSTLLVICSSGTAPTYSVTETNVISSYASFDASYALHAVLSEHVVLTQPTHPKYHTKIDSVCNVCLEPFTGVGEPPSRHEQILAYTGAELAALIVSRAFPSYTRSILTG